MVKEFKFENIEKGRSPNVINLFFTDRLDFHEGQYEVEVLDVDGDLVDYTKEWFLDKKNYVVGTTHTKVYVRYNDGAAAMDLTGLSFKLRYKAKQRDTRDNIVEGNTSISL